MVAKTSNGHESPALASSHCPDRDGLPTQQTHGWWQAAQLLEEGGHAGLLEALLGKGHTVLATELERLLNDPEAEVRDGAGEIIYAMRARRAR